jgi:hypothetical protein
MLGAKNSGIVWEKKAWGFYLGAPLGAIGRLIFRDAILKKKGMVPKRRLELPQS